MRAAADLPNVLMPTLVGRHIFAVFNRYGYTQAVLARSESAFRDAARPHVLGGERLDFGPCVIDVVRPSAEMLAYILDEHANAVELDLVENRLRWRVERYVELMGELPPGFEYKEKGDIYIADDTRASWTGAELVAKRFASLLGFEEAEGARSVAPPATGTVHYASESYSASGGISAYAFDDGPPVHWAPMFYFEIVAPADVLAPLLAEKAEADALAALEWSKHEAENAERVRLQDAKDLAELRALFLNTAAGEGVETA